MLMKEAVAFAMALKAVAERTMEVPLREGLETVDWARSTILI